VKGNVARKEGSCGGAYEGASSKNTHGSKDFVKMACVKKMEYSTLVTLHIKENGRYDLSVEVVKYTG
jgi:hypothetical protein